jgi:hypothetical protein
MCLALDGTGVVGKPRQTVVPCLGLTNFSLSMEIEFPSLQVDSDVKRSKSIASLKSGRTWLQFGCLRC